MGYEYHDRRRDWRGRFDTTHRNTQVHMYCTWSQWRTLKLAALNAAEDLSTYCRNAALERASKDLTKARVTEEG